MPNLKPQSIRNLGTFGVIRQAEVDDSLIPEGAVTEATNFHFDRKGAATVRLGLAALGSTVSTVTGATVVGLHNAQNSTMAVAVSIGATTVVYRYNGSTWPILTNNLTATTTVRFVDFSNNTLIITGAYDSLRVWSGSTGAVTTSGNPLNPDQFTHDSYVNTQTLRAKFGEVYKSRIYLAGDATTPSRLFFSSVISGTGNITWTPGTDYVDINPGDGEGISALKRYSLELGVYKPNYIYRFRTTGVDPDPLIKIGTRSQESIVEGKKGMYFHHDTGFYRYSGGYPEEISRPISDFIAAIPYSQFASIAAWKDTDHIYWSVGNLSIPDTTTGAGLVSAGLTAWKNVVCRFTESSELWTVYSYSSDIRRGSQFNNGSTLTQVIGNDAGTVATLNSGTTDLGETIKFHLVTKFYEHENIVTRKSFNLLAALCEKAQDMQLFYQTDSNPEWYALGALTSYLTFFKKQSNKYHRIRFKVSGVTKVESAIFQGIEILEGTNEGIVPQ